MALESPLYTPLDAAHPSARLLTAEAKDAADADDLALSFSLAPVRLNECPPFVALSYVWGDPSVGSEIITVNGHPKRIGANLAAAFRFFRKTHQPSALGAEASPELPRHIWVDALCINQEDNSEKYVQVSHMESIYKSASIVLAHPGNGSAQPYQGYDTIRTLGKAWHRFTTECNRAPTGDEYNIPRTGPVLFDEPKAREALEELASNLTNSVWSSVKAFLHPPYWSRVWIVQEIVLGREVMLVLGALEPITWADHRNAMLLTQQLPRILNGFAVYDASIWDRFEGSVEL